MRAAGIASATRAIQSGLLVVLPTDTVYGVGADAFDPIAVRDVLAVKGRGRDMPLPVLVGSWDTIDGLVSSVSPMTRDLIEAFWPGGLTLVVEHAKSLTWDWAIRGARSPCACRSIRSRSSYWPRLDRWRSRAPMSPASRRH